AAAKPFEIAGTVGASTDITATKDGRSVPLTVAFTGLRVINVEDLSGELPQPNAAIEHVASVTGSAAGAKNEHLRNVGPSVQYRITGEDGQSYEYTNYMMPMELDGSLVFLAGVRESAAQPYRYMRIPADDQGTVTEFMALRAALAEPALVQQAVARFARKNATQAMSAGMLEKAAKEIGRASGRERT